MDIRPRSRLRNKASHILNILRKRLENEGAGGTARQTGEAHFISDFMRDHAGNSVVVFDVGASTGEYGDMITRAAQNVSVALQLHAFEPIGEYSGPGTFNKVAASDTHSETKMFTRRSDDTSSMYRGENLDKKHGVATQVNVRTIRLDTYMKDNNVSHVDLLKIDVQGHELAVLRGLGEYLRPELVRWILFEYDSTYIDAALRLQDMYRLLQKHGYRICKVFPHHLEETPYQVERENFNYANYVAL
jgi:FkbM family methyltransferase